MELDFDAEAFLGSHWRPRIPAVLRGVMPDGVRAEFRLARFAAWLKPPVSGLLYTRALDSSGRVAGTRDAIGDISRALGLFRASGTDGAAATLFLYDLNRVASAFVALRDATRIGQAWRSSSFSATISAAGGGIGYHADIIDVMLFQAQGRRRWRVFAPAAHGSPERRELCEGGVPTREGDWNPPDGATPVLDAELGPGDAIFLPALHFHDGTTLPSGEDSVAICIGWRAVTPFMFLKAMDGPIAHDRLERLRDGMPGLFEPIPDVPAGQALLVHLREVLGAAFAPLGEPALAGPGLRQRIATLLLPRG